MIEDHPALEQTFSALADRTRLAIIGKLAMGESSLSELAEPFEMSQTAVSKHVNILSEAGLVKVSKRGRTRYCEVHLAPMKQAQDWLETYQKFWAKQLDNLSDFLEEDRTKSDNNEKN